MKTLKLILVVSFIAVNSGCALLGETVILHYKRPPELPIDKGRFLVTPFVVQTLERVQEDTAAKIFLQYCETTENEKLIFLPYEKYPNESIQKMNSAIINDEIPDISFLSSDMIDYVITGTVFYEMRFYGDRLTDDKMSPVYSADYGGAPGFWETSEEWRKRSFSNLVFEVRVQLLVWSVNDNKKVFNKKVSHYIILEDYKDKNVKDERDNAYQILLQETARTFLMAFIPGVVRVQRIFLR